MQLKDYIIIGIILILLIGAVIFDYTQDQKRDERIENIKADQQKEINLDSLQSAIEKRIIDSLDNRSAAIRKELSYIRKEYHTIRKENEKLEDLYYSTPVELPEL